MLRFGRLSFGTYELHIKGQDITGKWSKNELVFTIRVIRPFYLQAWFLILIGLILITIPLAYLKWRNISLKQQ